MAISAAEADLAAQNTSSERILALVESSRDVLGPWLDDQFKTTVTDHKIFQSLAAYWEDSFMSDMARLRVQPPDTLTRVTEYVPEIVSYVERIVENGYGYTTDDGSVYFDTRAFDGKHGVGNDWAHVYAKLMPGSKGNTELLEEGEGTRSHLPGARRRSTMILT